MCHVSSAQTAQAGVETIVAVGTIALLFVVVLFVYAQNSATVEDLETRFAGSDACSRISSAIGSAYANPDMDMNFEIAQDANVLAVGEIAVGDYFCDYVGRAQDAGLIAGTVNARRVGDAVVLENV